jgi:aminopeptidase N
VRPDLVLLNDGDDTYAKIRLDERSLATLTESIERLTESLPRSLCWAAAWDMTRDAELSTSAYITLTLRGVRSEPDSSVIRTVLRQCLSASSVYTAPRSREHVRARLADGLWQLIEESVSGSDSQLQFVRAFASAACAGEHLALVRNLLMGEKTLTGVTVDTDLRWHLLQQLVRAGAADEAEIDAELERDDTATGRRQAAAARASRPDAQAKDDVWAAVVEGDDLPNAIQTAAIGGFAQPGQETLLQPFRTRYFGALNQVWAERTNETAQNIVIGLFPSLLADEETLAAADAWLDANGSSPPALRRLVGESRDMVARALRAQAKDAEDIDVQRDA